MTKLGDVEEGRVLIAGLGNPGREHKGDRHNIGFMALDRLAHKHAIKMDRMQLRALVGRGHIVGRSVLLAKPQTYMNRSGDAIGPLANYYKISDSRILVVYDELDLPLGVLRMRKSGGSGGHNGMKSIIQHTGQSFARLRLGVSRPPGRLPSAAYLLQGFSDQEADLVDHVLDEAVAAIESFLDKGVELAMTQHNRDLTSGQ